MLYQAQTRPRIARKGNMLIKQRPPLQDYSSIYAQYHMLGRLQRQDTKVHSNRPRAVEWQFSSTPEICKLVQPKVSAVEKYFWVCIVLVISSVCAYQVMQAILLYASNPVKIDVDIVPQHFVRFPAITVCPHHRDLQLARDRKVVEAMLRNGVNPMEYPERDFTLKELKLKLDDLVNAGAIENNDVRVATPCFKKMESNPCNKSIDVRQKMRYTLFGRCLTVIPKKAIQFRGPSSSLLVEINRTKAMLYIHEPANNAHHDIFFLAEPVYVEVKTVKSLSTKEFNFLNTRGDPCISAAEAFKCRDTCINKKIAANNDVPCSSKVFSLSNKKECQSLNEAKSAMNAVEEAYINLTPADCVCTRKCKDVVYTITTDTRLLSGNHSVIEIKLVFSESVKEVVTETLTYSFAALISDVGGSLGFYVGFCILQCLETIVRLLKKFKG